MLASTAVQSQNTVTQILAKMSSYTILDAEDVWDSMRFIQQLALPQWKSQSKSQNTVTSKSQRENQAETQYCDCAVPNSKILSFGFGCSFLSPENRSQF